MNISSLVGRGVLG